MNASSMALLFLPWVAFSQANPWYQTDFPPEEFKARWGKVFEKIGDKAVAVLQGVSQTRVFARWKFSKPAYEKAAREQVDRGGGVLSHPVGMAVHDDGSYDAGTLRPGHIFSIDPQLRVPDENLYIRYEDVIVVTENGLENFTGFLPSELSEIEKLVGSGGVVQKVPPEPEGASHAQRGN
jgi:Metallopeptidase family M24